MMEIGEEDKCWSDRYENMNYLQLTVSRPYETNLMDKFRKNFNILRNDGATKIS